MTTPYLKPSDEYGHIPSETVNQAIEDRANGNRPILAKVALQRRIAEVQYDRAKEHNDFVNFMKNVYMRVKQ